MTSILVKRFIEKDAHIEVLFSCASKMKEQLPKLKQYGDCLQGMLIN